MNRKHIVGYGLTAIACFAAGLSTGGSGAPDTTTPPAAVTATTTAAAPTPAAATVTVSPPAVTETLDADTVTETATTTVETEAVTETVTVGPPEPEEAISGSGTFEVGVDVQPGTYVSEGASDGCYWARLSGSDGFDSIIDNSFAAGQMIVTIKESDRFFETSGCAPWAQRSR